MDRLRAMQTFVRIVDGGSLSAAARALGVTLPAIVRTLAALEAHLGVRLLTRTTRRMALTDAGSEYYQRCRQLVSEVDEAELAASAAKSRPAGTLSVTAPVLFGRMHVVPLLTEYRRRFPEVAVRLLLLDRNVNLLEEGIDVAIRIGHLADSSMVAARLGEVRRLVCASPAYLKKRGTPRHPRELASHDCLSLTALTAGDSWQFREGGRSFEVKLRPRFVSNSGDAVIAMAESGQGIGIALSYQIEAQLARRRLAAVLEDFAPAPLPVSALHAHGRLTAAKVREFIELAAARLKSARAKVPAGLET
jgi:DNA-binding transcriptional LysR family regulator